MNRQVVAGILGLALAGCAQDRSSLKSQNSKLGSVELTPAMPSIHEAINISTESLEAPTQPVENVQVTQAEPSTPPATEVVQQTPAPALDQRVERVSATQSEPPALVGNTEQAAIAANPAMVPVPQNLDPVTNPPSATESVASRTPEVQAVADPIPPAQTPLSVRDPLLGANPDIMPSMELPTERPPQTPTVEQSAAPLATPAVIQQNPVMAEPVNMSTIAEGNPTQRSPMPVEPDPLLGDHPEIMPSFDLPASPTTIKDAPLSPPSQAPEAPKTPALTQPVEQAKIETPAPAAVAAPVPQPVPVAVVAPVPQPTPPVAAPVPRPAPVEKVSAPAPAVSVSPEPAPDPAAPAPLPFNPEDLINQPIELPPLSAPDDDKTSAVIRPSGDTTNPLRQPGTVLTSSMFVEPKGEKDSASSANPEKQKAGDDAAALRSKIPPRSVFEAGKAMARVGEEVITLRELKFAVKQRRGMIPPGQQLTAEESYMLAKGVLNDLVDRALVLQEARREIKNPKQLKMFMDMADKIWKDEELPPLLRKHSVANIYELKEKLIENNDSIEELRDAYRQDFLFRGYIDQKLGPKMKVELPEMIDYYNEHIHDFDHIAQTTWREVVIEVSLHPNRAAAKKKADAALARLRRGDDFATVAAEMSEGPNKAKGGLWKTAPGSYNVASVNTALETLPIGQISQVVEGPSEFDIVRVEARRAAGPSTFAEVQDNIRRTIRGQKVHAQSTAYLESLRKKTPVSTVFDNLDGVQQASADIEESPRKSASK